MSFLKSLCNWFCNISWQFILPLTYVKRNNLSQRMIFTTWILLTTLVSFHCLNTRASVASRNFKCSPLPCHVMIYLVLTLVWQCFILHSSFFLPRSHQIVLCAWVPLRLFGTSDLVFLSYIIFVKKRMIIIWI